MKKIIALVLALLLMTALLAACGKAETPAAAPANTSTDVTAFKTIGDVLAAPVEPLQSSSVNNTYIYGFQQDGVVYRAIAEMPQDVADAYYGLDWLDPDLETKQNELLSPLAIIRVENVTEMVQAGPDAAAYVGKTGGDLLDEGFSVYFWDLEKMEFGMNYGAGAYTVVFDAHVDEADWDDFSEEDIRDMTVKSMECTGVGDVTWYEP